MFPGWRPQFWIAALLGAVTALLLYVFYRDLSPRVRAFSTRCMMFSRFDRGTASCVPTGITLLSRA